jgi:hypothetical protein
MSAPGEVETRGRLRFTDFSLDRLASGLCLARVVLAWPDVGTFVGESTGLSSQAGELRCAAQACLDAIARAIPDAGFELVGVKSVRAFDATVVIASLATKGRLDGPRVVGSSLVQDDTPRGAALAVLNATNRLLTGQVKA